MKIKELKVLIKEKFGAKEFTAMVRHGEDWDDRDAARFKQELGLDYSCIESERSSGSGDYDGWTWRFQIGDKFYEVEGWYGSYSGRELNDAFDFIEIEYIEQTIKVWSPVEDKDV